MLKETLGHTRMLQWTWMGAGHWFVFIGFGLLFFTLLTAFGQLFDAHFALPLIGHFFLYEWVSEFFTVGMLIAIVGFIGYRATRPKERTRGAKGRFFGSTMWQAYFVESVILGVGLCIAVLRGAEYAISQYAGEQASGLHYPFSSWIGHLMSGMSESALANTIYLVAMIKILISFTWMIVDLAEPTMGVAWHRFTAFFNIWFKRKADGGTALGGLSADHGRRCTDRLREHRGARRGRTARRRQGRGLRLEGHPRLHLVHRVRPLPEPVPGLEHREAAVPQAAHHRRCVTTPTPRRRTCRPTRTDARRRSPTTSWPRPSASWSAPPRATRRCRPAAP